MLYANCWVGSNPRRQYDPFLSFFLTPCHYFTTLARSHGPGDGGVGGRMCIRQSVAQNLLKIGERFAFVSSVSSFFSQLDFLFPGSSLHMNGRKSCYIYRNHSVRECKLIQKGRRSVDKIIFCKFRVSFEGYCQWAVFFSASFDNILNANQSREVKPNSCWGVLSFKRNIDVISIYFDFSSSRFLSLVDRLMEKIDHFWMWFSLG